MKATVELPDELVIAAKKRAAEQRRPLRDLIEQGLRAELARTRKVKLGPGQPVKLRWVTVDGGLPEELDLANRAAMHEWLRTHE